LIIHKFASIVDCYQGSSIWFGQWVVCVVCHVAVHLRRLKMLQHPCLHY